jgi:hypothetical protein
MLKKILPPYENMSFCFFGGYVLRAVFRQSHEGGLVVARA